MCRYKAVGDTLQSLATDFCCGVSVGTFGIMSLSDFDFPSLSTSLVPPKLEINLGDMDFSVDPPNMVFAQKA